MLEVSQPPVEVAVNSSKDNSQPPKDGEIEQKLTNQELTNQDLVEQLLAIGTALSCTSNLGSLLNLILYKSREITCSDAGSVYLVDNSTNKPTLIFKTAQNDYLGKNTLEEFTIPLTADSLAGYVALTGESLNIPDAYAIPDNVPYKMNQNFDRSIPYYTRSVLVLPMQDQEGETIGVLQLINRKINAQVTLTPEIAREVTQPYSGWEEQIIRSLASQAAISIERSQLQASIERLFEGFVKASVKIIEARDPTTSGHSERVAELTVRLTEEVNQIGIGTLGSWYFNNRQIQEVRYAALLHDFGKVSIPEQVLNKRKKLHASQLQIIHQRFTIVKQALQVQCGETKFRYLVEHPSAYKSHNSHQPDFSCDQCAYVTQLEADLQKAIAQLDAYWELVVQMNKPDLDQNRSFQALTEETLLQLTELTKYTYRDMEGKTKPLLTSKEIQQLMVAHGNLTSQERHKIQAHVSNTYEFLQQIPWTKYLRDVPQIAYAHHEKLNGTGYPQGLVGPEIPFQSQMLTIADIYDALTAADRPYKRRLDLKTAANILWSEAQKNHINQDLVELFLQRQVFTVLGHQMPSD